MPASISCSSTSGARAGGSASTRSFPTVSSRRAASTSARRSTRRCARELRRVAQSFNAMTARLEARRAVVKQAEREAAWREVARHLAHELKNPLTAMRYALHRVQRRAELVPIEERAAVQSSLD